MQLTFAGFHQPKDGYGYATIKIAAALLKDAPETTVLNLGVPVLDEAQRWETYAPTVALCTPDWLPLIDTNGAPLVSYTMFEATRLPAGWVEKLNRYAVLVLVPCAWCKTIFEANGVTRPIEIIKWGIDPQDYFPLKRRHKGRPYTFLWSGTPDGRKGWSIAYTAFRRAFGDRKDVRLVMHFRQMPPGIKGVLDDNVQLIEGLFDLPKLREMLQDADCFVFPSRGEGWGLPPREAAATGLPVIATDYGGLAEDIYAWALPITTKGMSIADYGPEEWGDLGYWAEPDGAVLEGWLHWCVEHPEDAADFGRRAASTMARTPWERTAREIVEVLRCRLGL